MQNITLNKSYPGYEYVQVSINKVILYIRAAKCISVVSYHGGTRYGSYKVKVVIIIYKTTDYSLANKKSKRIAEALHQAWNIIRQNLLY